MLALRGLELCSFFVFLFAAKSSKIHGLGGEISQKALQTSTRLVVLGYSKIIFFLPNQVVFRSMLCLGRVNLVALFNQLFVVFEKLDGARVFS